MKAKEPNPCTDLIAIAYIVFIGVILFFELKAEEIWKIVKV